MDRSHGGRVSHEADVELAAGNAIGDAMAEAALPGVFASGKTIKETASWRDPNGLNIMLRFDDGSSMTFIGEFTVDAQQGMQPRDDFDQERELRKAGLELMSGQEQDGGE